MNELIQSIYESVLLNKGGDQADYIPQLKNVNPDLFGVAFCDVNGNIFKLGDWENEFSIQSCSKPLNYC